VTIILNNFGLKQLSKNLSNRNIFNATMSSGFVSAGTNEAPIQRSNEWLAAQQELEAVRQRKAAEARQSDGRSLFETLEANKGT